jgi:hypothetical protein
MRKILIILSVFVLIVSGCGQKQAETKKEDTSQQILSDTLSDNGQAGTLKDIHDFSFTKENIACPFGYSLYGKFPLKQKWTTMSFSNNQIITAETKQNYYDEEWDNLYTSLVEQGKELTLHFDIAFKGAYSEKEIEILPLTKENDNNIIDLIKHNIPTDIAVKEFWKKHNPEYEEKPFIITNIQPYSFINNGNKFWIAYCKFRFEDTERIEGIEYDEVGLVGITANKEVVLLSGYCVYEKDYPAYLFRLKDEVLLYVRNDTCGEGAIITTRLYKTSNNFEKIFDETVAYD